MAWFYGRLSPCGGCVELPSEGRTVGFGLLAAVSAFGGVLAAGYGSVLFLGSGGASPLLADAWLLFVFAIAPALAVYLVVTLVARLLGGAEHAFFAAASALFGGVLALGGSFAVSGLFLFVGWYLFPWAFAYAAMIIPNLLRKRSARARAVGLHVAVATAVYLPWIALALYRAVDNTAEMAGAREGAGWIENFPTAIVLSMLYGMVIIAAVAAIRSPGLGRRRGQPAPSDEGPMP